MKEPDRKKPRARKTLGMTIHSNHIKKFRTKYPQYKQISQKEYSTIIDTFHEEIKLEAMKNPFGVVLPYKLGLIILKRANFRSAPIDYKESFKQNKVVKYRMMETEGYRVCISYVNNLSSCVVKNKNLLYFIPVRSFKLEVSKHFVKNWQKVLVMPQRIKNIVSI